MLVPIIRVISTLEILEKWRTLLSNTAAIDYTIKDKTVKAKNGDLNFFYSNFAVYDSCLNAGSQPIGKLTGDVFRSKYNGELYAKVQLTRTIGTVQGTVYDNELIWVQMKDLEFVTQTQAQSSSKSSLLILAVLAGLLLFGKDL